MSIEVLFHLLGTVVVFAPAALLTALGLPSLVGLPLTERWISRLTQTSVISGLLAAVSILGLMLLTGTRVVPVEFGDWVVIPESHFHFTLKFVFDRLSVPFLILSYVLVGTIGGFANVYLHREPGFNRFFVIYAVFLLGMVLATLAGTIESLFAGWELVGLSSALLLAFFQEREGPVRNGMRVWSMYRVADGAFLVAAIALHQLTGSGSFEGMMGAGPWPEGHASLTPNQAFFVGMLLLIAASGKSALVPFSGWLPRAMDGPTPSSAVYYGALSVHLGAFLLLRVGPILELSTWLRVAVVVVGIATALLGAIASRVKSDIKGALAFASMTQVGIIVAEIGFGLRYIALVHIIGHACLRTLQLLRAPNLLHDYHQLENAIGGRLPRPLSIWERVLPSGFRLWVYRFALEGGYLDALLTRFIVSPFLALFRRCDQLERKWTQFLTQTPPTQPDVVSTPPEVLEEFL